MHNVVNTYHCHYALLYIVNYVIIMYYFIHFCHVYLLLIYIIIDTVL